MTKLIAFFGRCCSLTFSNIRGAVGKLHLVGFCLSHTHAFMLRLKAIFNCGPYRFSHVFALFLFLGIILGLFESVWQPGPLLDYLRDCYNGHQELRLF